MASSMVDQFRPLLAVWLLLTLPIICHDQPTVVSLDNVTAAYRLHAAAAPTEQGPLPAPTAHQHLASAFAHGPGSAHAAAPTSESHVTIHRPGWSADHGIGGTQLPSSPDGSAVLAVVAAEAPEPSMHTVFWPDVPGPTSLHPSPTAPPPRHRL